MCNECPSCRSKNLQKVINIFMRLVHSDTEVKIGRYCLDCGCNFTSTYQFDSHEIKN
jgi:transcriptional regulator NrdR family protein